MSVSQKILLVVQNYPSDSPFLLKKFQELNRSNKNVHLFCLEWSPKMDPTNSSVHYAYGLNFKSVFKFIFDLVLNFGWVLKQFKSIKSFKSFFRDFPIMVLKPDVIHFEFGTLALTRMYLKNILNCKMIISFRGYDLNYAGLEQKDYYKEVWEKADLLHFLGEDLWKRAQKRGCPPDKRHVLISPAIDTDFFNPRLRQDNLETGTQKNPLKILSVGRLAWKKGYEYGLQAVKLLKDKGIYCDYKIVGGGDYLEAVSFATHQLGLEEEVKLLGSKTQEETKELLQETDVFLHSAVSEGFCNAVLEAQAMKLPVVCTDADGLPENIEEGKTGFVVPRRDPVSIAEKIKRLAEDLSQRKQMGEEGRKRVETNFKIEKQIAAFEKMYKEISNNYAN